MVYFHKKSHAPFLSATVTLLLSALLILYSFSIFNTKVEFDDAYNLQVSQNIVQKGIYATNGSQFDGTYKLFDPNISTGPTVLLIMALSFEVFGVGVWQYRAICVLIFMLMVFLAYLYIRRMSHADPRAKYTHIYQILLTTVVGVLFAGLAPYSTYSSTIGEPLAFCFLLAAGLLLDYKKILAAALMIGLAILTKTICLLAVPFFVIAILIQYKTWKMKLFFGITSLTIVAIPTVAFELYRFVSLGDLAAYKASVKEFLVFFSQAGSGVSDTTPTVLSITSERLSYMLYGSPLTASLPFAAALLLLCSYSLHRLVSTQKQHINRFLQHPIVKEPVYLYLTGTVLLWFGWWFIISENGWPRHALPALLIIITMIASIINNSIANSHFSPPRLVMILLIVIVSLSYALIAKMQPYANDLASQRAEISQVSKVFGNHQYYHLGWWQNPEVQFILNRASRPYIPGPHTSDQYILMSTMHEKLAKESYDNDRALCDSFQIISPTYRLCITRRNQ